MGPWAAWLLYPGPMQTVREVRARCARLPSSAEDFPFDAHTLVFTVAGKMYALCALDREPLGLSLKARPDDGEALRAAYPGIVPGHHLNKRHWITLTPALLPAGLPGELLAASYALVAAGLPRAARASLGA
jgi:predicted DNA-binding protein (MmcQ/YjbR family)